jgi:hypothetical protein
LEKGDALKLSIGWPGQDLNLTFNLNRVSNRVLRGRRRSGSALDGRAEQPSFGQRAQNDDMLLLAVTADKKISSANRA